MLQHSLLDIGIIMASSSTTRMHHYGEQLINIRTLQKESMSYSFLLLRNDKFIIANTVHSLFFMRKNQAKLSFASNHKSRTYKY